MEIRRYASKTMKIALPIILGGAILYWMYRGFDFSSIEDVLLHGMDWTWMILSLPFGVLAQAFRGWRWKQTLEPLDEHPRTSVCVNAIYISYAASLVIPRIGEFARCGVLSRYDDVSFPKALGTVVTERAVDTLVLALIVLITFLSQIKVFATFFSKTGTRIDVFFTQFSTAGWIVTIICGIAALVSLYFAFRKLFSHKKIQSALMALWQGIISLKDVKNIWLFLAYSIGIWAAYFLHFYLPLFCFSATSHLSIASALAAFVIGSIAVIVPTPNGAGPFHFAVKTMLVLYGIGETDALYFVLILHAVQTFLVVLIGLYGWVALAFTKRKAAISH